jgi:hypothetical protein
VLVDPGLARVGDERNEEAYLADGLQYVDLAQFRGAKPPQCLDEALRGIPGIPGEEVRIEGSTRPRPPGRVCRSGVVVRVTFGVLSQMPRPVLRRG